MDLRTYIQGERGRGTVLAKALKIPASYLSQMASGERTITAERASAIERATDRQVMRWDSCPGDWHETWPELVGTEGAPQPSVSVSKEA